MIKTPSKKAGFSLIELLFAMIFLTVIVFGVVKLQTSNLTLSNTRQMELRAQTYVAEGLEIVAVFDEGTVSSKCNDENECYLKKGGSAYSLVGNSPVESLENGLFTRIVQWSDINLNDAIMVTVVVEWEDSSGEHSVSASRILY